MLLYLPSSSSDRQTSYLNRDEAVRALQQDIPASLSHCLSSRSAITNDINLIYMASSGLALERWTCDH